MYKRKHIDQIMKLLLLLLLLLLSSPLLLLLPLPPSSSFSSPSSSSPSSPSPGSTWLYLAQLHSTMALLHSTMALLHSTMALLLPPPPLPHTSLPPSLIFCQFPPIPKDQLVLPVAFHVMIAVCRRESHSAVSVIPAECCSLMEYLAEVRAISKLHCPEQLTNL